MTWLIGEEGPISVIRAPSGPRGPAGPGVASTVTYDDTRTVLGAANVQAAILALALIVAALRAATLDFTNPNQSGLLALGV